jgi:hypothetical protein
LNDNLKLCRIKDEIILYMDMALDNMYDDKSLTEGSAVEFKTK